MYFHPQGRFSFGSVIQKNSAENQHIRAGSDNLPFYSRLLARWQNYYQIFGNAGNDHIWGGDGDDTIFGNSTSTDRLSGEGGSDLIHGFGGNDLLNGGLGDDDLFGWDVDDLLVGSYGIVNSDNLDGGSGDGGSGDDCSGDPDVEVNCEI